MSSINARVGGLRTQLKVWESVNARIYEVLNRTYSKIGGLGELIWRTADGMWLGSEEAYRDEGRQSGQASSDRGAG